MQQKCSSCNTPSSHFSLYDKICPECRKDRGINKVIWIKRAYKHNSGWFIIWLLSLLSPLAIALYLPKESDTNFMFFFSSMMLITGSIMILLPIYMVRFIVARRRINKLLALLLMIPAVMIVTSLSLIGSGGQENNGPLGLSSIALLFLAYGILRIPNIDTTIETHDNKLK